MIYHAVYKLVKMHWFISENPRWCNLKMHFLLIEMRRVIQIMSMLMNVEKLLAKQLFELRCRKVSRDVIPRL